MPDESSGPQTRTRVVVALTGAPGNAAIVRRAAEVARRTDDELLGVHVRVGDAPREPAPLLDAARAVLADLGGTYHEIVGSDVAAALVEFCRAEHAAELVIGAAGHGPWWRRGRASVHSAVLAQAHAFDVRVVGSTDGAAADAPARGGRRSSFATNLRHRSGARAPHRARLAWVIAPVLLAVLTIVLIALRDTVSLAAGLLLFLLVVVVVASIGGRVVALVTAGAAFLLANWFLTPPVHTWTIGHPENVIALIVFLTVAAVVSNYVSIAARRAMESERARAEAESLARLSTTFADTDPLGAVVRHLRSTFGLAAVAVLRHGDAGSWHIEASAGDDPPTTPAAAGHVEPVGDGVVLACVGRQLTDDDRRVLRAFAAQLAAAVERAELAREASRADALDKANSLRTALLQSVSHDLRTPLAAIKASVSSLREPDIEWPVAQQVEFLTSIEDETDRLTALVTNLLDLSRIQAGELHPGIRAVSLEEVVPAALHSLGSVGNDVVLELPDALPDVAVDPALLERVVANLVANAVRFAPAGEPVVVRATVVRTDDTGSGTPQCAAIALDVIDRGPGIAPALRAEVVRPFQRLEDSRHNGGVGLGLAIAEGFTRAMRATLTLVDTPGGGLTARVTLPLSAGPSPSGTGAP